MTEKFNNIEQKISSNAWEMSAGEFENSTENSFENDFQGQKFSLEYLNKTSEIAKNESAREAELSQRKADVLRIYGESETRGGFESFENSAENDLSQMNAMRGREENEMFGGAREAREMSMRFDGYDADFAIYGGRGAEFVARNENRERTAVSLSKEIAEIKSVERSVSARQKWQNFGKAILGRTS